MDEKCILDPQRDCIGKAEAAKLEGRMIAIFLSPKSGK